MNFLLFQLFFSFLKIGAFTFGGGYAMIPLIQREIIVSHHWINLDQFLEIVAIAEMTPGPIAINTATFVGYRVAGIPGSISATLGVITPSLFIVTILSNITRRYSSSPWLNAITSSIRPVVVGLILTSSLLIARPVFTDLKAVLIGIGVFILLFTEKVHPIRVILLSGVLGILLY